MKIAVIGTGYVGLVSGACLAERGHRVICVDIRADVVSAINAGHPPIHEAGLDELLRKVRENTMLTAVTDAKSAICDSEVTLICVGTPTVDGRMDLSQVVAAAEVVGEALATKGEFHVVAVKSTVLPGTTEGPVLEAIERRSGKKVGDGWGLCMNPEFLREGRAIADFRVPDRIVVGATDQKTADQFLKVYEDFYCPKLVTTPRTAEMIKYVSNSMLATMISFSNEIGNLCSALPGVDASQVWKGVHLDRRLTPVSGQVGGGPAGVTEYLWHGLGFGGSCFPKDVAALRGFGRMVNEPTRMLDAVLQINQEQPLRMVSLLKKEMDLSQKRVTVLGLAFKPGTDDLRESPALSLVRELLKEGVTVVAHDPIALVQARKHPDFAGVMFADNWMAALQDADACCLVTAWPEYSSIPPAEFVRRMRHPLLIDGRGIFDPASCAVVGVIWRGVGYTPERG